MLDSKYARMGVVNFPMFTGTRIMMMPFHIEAPHDTLPDYLQDYATIVAQLKIGRAGVGYLTVDEAVVPAGQCHRRPGLHIDGMGSWGGGSPWASRGMVIAASITGCRAYSGLILGSAGDDGDCEHLRTVLPNGEDLEAGQAYWMGATTIHEAIPMQTTGPRQFLRISMPSAAPWYEGYTKNPLGILPSGPVLQRRDAQMSYRP